MKTSKTLMSVWLVALSLPAAVPALLTGCQPVKPAPPPTVSVTACAALSVIKIPEEDVGTISLTLTKRISDHNVAYKRLCEKK